MEKDEAIEQIIKRLIEPRYRVDGLHDEIRQILEENGWVKFDTAADIQCPSHP